MTLSAETVTSRRGACSCRRLNMSTTPNAELNPEHARSSGMQNLLLARPQKPHPTQQACNRFVFRKWRHTGVKYSIVRLRPVSQKPRLGPYRPRAASGRDVDLAEQHGGGGRAVDAVDERARRVGHNLARGLPDGGPVQHKTACTPTWGREHVSEPPVLGAWRGASGSGRCGTQGATSGEGRESHATDTRRAGRGYGRRRAGGRGVRRLVRRLGSTATAPSGPNGASRAAAAAGRWRAAAARRATPPPRAPRAARAAPRLASPRGSRAARLRCERRRHEGGTAQCIQSTA